MLAWSCATSAWARQGWPCKASAAKPRKGWRDQNRNRLEQSGMTDNGTGQRVKGRRECELLHQQKENQLCAPTQRSNLLSLLKRGKNSQVYIRCLQPMLQWRVKCMVVCGQQTEGKPGRCWCSLYGAVTGWCSLYRQSLLHICWKLKNTF